MEKRRQISPYILLFCLTIVISCTKARKLLTERNVMQSAVHSTKTRSSPNHVDVDGTMVTTDDNRPSSPGHSPGVGHRTFKVKVVEKNL